MDDMQKYQVMSLLQQEVVPKDIAENLNVSYGAVLKLRRQFDEARTNGTIDALINTKRLILDKVESELEVLPNATDAIAEITKGLKGIEHLSEEFQETAMIMNGRIRQMLTVIEDINELEVATDILCKLQTAFVNKQMTNVNVQNNFGTDTTPKYSQFLSDKPND